MFGLNPWLLLVATITILGAFGGVYFKGRVDGSNSCAAKYASAYSEGVKRHASIKKEVMRLTTDDLKRRYCKWVRDSEDECLRADIPVSEGQTDTRNNAASSNTQ